MRLHFPRFTVRRLMILAAVTALAIQATRWGIEMRRLWLEREVRAEVSEIGQALGLWKAEYLKKNSRAYRTGSAWPPVDLLIISCEAAKTADYLREADYFRRLGLAERRASRYPWLPLETVPEYQSRIPWPLGYKGCR